MQLGIAIPKRFYNPGLLGLNEVNPGIPELNPGLF